MDSFLKPFVPELKIKDYKTYQAFRNGLIVQLSHDYGIFSYQVLGADTVLFALLCDSLAGREGTCTNKRSILYAFHRRSILSQTYGIRFACQIQIILTWYKLIEKKERDRSVFSKMKCSLLQLLLKNSYIKALDVTGLSIERIILQEKDHAAAVALTQCSDYEIASEPLANLFSSLFLHCASDDASWKSLQQFGYHLGRICFFIREIQCYDNDKVLGAYNIFLQNGLTKEVAIETAKRHCNLAAVDLARASALLNLQLNRSLLDNIIYLGLEHAVEELGQVPSGVWEF